LNPLIRRVVVTGVGAVTPLGGDTNTSWKNLIDGKSGASSITRFDATGFPCTIACEVPLGAGIKQAREQFQLSNHKRLMDIYSSSSKTIDALMKLELPSGVHVEIKVI
jgi:3-oxoacyl-(acyl-carrier-protein) synthase